MDIIALIILLIVLICLISISIYAKNTAKATERLADAADLTNGYLKQLVANQRQGQQQANLARDAADQRS